MRLQRLLQMGLPSVLLQLLRRLLTESSIERPNAFMKYYLWPSHSSKSRNIADAMIPLKKMCVSKQHVNPQSSVYDPFKKCGFQSNM